MSASGVSTSRAGHRTAGSASEAFEQARWLAWKDIKRAWLSYPLSALFLLFFGLITVPNITLVLEERASSPSNLTPLFPDFLLVIAGCFFVVNAISLDYVRIWNSDVFSERTAFLLSLPLSTGTLVASRVLSMLAAVPFNVVAFFVPVYTLTGLSELEFSYVWFVGIWLGWGLLYAGVTLLCELGLSGRAYCWVSFALIAGIAIAVLVLDLLTGAGLITATANIAGAGYGPVAALVSVAFGSVGFWLLARLTVRRIGSREVGS